jgi:hypothetical protein
VGKVGKWTLAVALLGAACAKSHVADQGNPVVVPPDAGPVADAGPVDAGPPDAGPPDAGPPDAGPPAKFGGPGPWPIKNVEYGYADGIQEVPVVGVTTDEKQNLWVATNSALYLMRPSDTKFRRYDTSNSDLHLPGNPAAACDDAHGTHKPCPNGDAASPGISEIVGGGPDEASKMEGEVFVGYYGYHDWNRPDDGEWTDPWMHSGKLDRVRLKPDGSLEVIRFDMVSNNSPQYWHNKTVWKLVYDHFKHPHELYVGTDHGVDKISPDKWKEPDKGTWFLLPQNQQSWMSDHLHPRACYHHVCKDEDPDQRLGDWRGLAIDLTGDLWVAGRWAAGQIKYLADNTNWYNNPRNATGQSAFGPTFGDPYNGGCTDGRPIFCVPQEGDFVNLSAVTVTPDGRIWWASGVIYNEPADVNYGIAVYDHHQFTYFDPVRDAGMAETNVRDMLALPDGRLVLAGPNTGLTIWDPATRKHSSIRAGQGIPDDGIMRLQLDTMVNPPALHVATRGGAAVLRVLP